MSRPPTRRSTRPSPRTTTTRLTRRRTTAAATDDGDRRRGRHRGDARRVATPATSVEARHREAAAEADPERRTADADDEEGRGLMGQKVNPYGFRLGVTTDWKSRWFATREEYVDYLIEDWKIRDYLMNKLPNAAISRIEVERHARSPAHRRPHRSSGHRHRSSRRPGRRAARRPHQADRQPQGPAEHPGDQAARARRRADRPGRRRPARQPDRIPPGHEAGRAERTEGRRPRHPGPVLGSPRRLRDVPHRVVPRGPCARCTRCGPTSTTASARPAPPPVASA